MFIMMKNINDELSISVFDIIDEKDRSKLRGSLDLSLSQFYDKSLID